MKGPADRFRFYQVHRYPARIRHLFAQRALRLKDEVKTPLFLPTIQWYLLRECLGPILVGILFFTLVFALQRIGELVALTMEKATPFSITSQLFIYMIPFTAAITVPMGVLFGIIATFGRLSGQSEIIAMRANRVSLLAMFLPILMVGVFFSGGLFYFINWVMPESNFRYKTLYKAVVYSNPGILLQDRVFTDLPNTDKKISTLGVSDDGKQMHSVFLYERDRTAGRVKIIYSENGFWLNNTLNSPLITLKLQKGRSLELGETNFDDVQALQFEETAFNIRNTIQTVEIDERDKGFREMNVVRVGKLIQSRLRAKVEISSELWIEYHKKYSIPAACLVFVFLGVPLGISFARSGRGISFGTAVGIIFIYYALLTLGETMGNKRVIPAQFSMWLPNIVLMVAGIYFFIRRARE